MTRLDSEGQRSKVKVPSGLRGGKRTHVDAKCPSPESMKIGSRVTTAKSAAQLNPAQCSKTDGKEVSVSDMEITDL